MASLSWFRIGFRSPVARQQFYQNTSVEPIIVLFKKKYTHMYLIQFNYLVQSQVNTEKMDRIKPCLNTFFICSFQNG